MTRSFRPSEAVCAIAQQIAGGLKPREVGGFGGAKIREIPRSWKNRRIIDAATMTDARQRYLSAKDFPPEQETRQQRRRDRLRGPNGA